MKIFGLLAHPVSQSQSPAMYEQWFHENAMEDARFELFDIFPENLADFMKRVKSEKISGLAVSIPHKEKVMAFLDEIDPVAAEIGAVNTVGWDGEKLKGWNTDWIGVLKALKYAEIALGGKRVLVLGAGGAARAVIYALMQAGANVVITNRTFDKAEDLSSHFRCPLVHWDDRESVATEIVVNTTSVGLEDPSSSPVSEAFWKGREAAFDLVYRPRIMSLSGELEGADLRPAWTKFLRDAEHAGVKILSGEQMLFYQGQKQFEILTGKKTG